jgi:hypothetical protein
MKRAVIAAQLGVSVLMIFYAVAMVLAFSGCGGYGHIPLAGGKSTAEKVDTVRVILKWNNIPNAVSYNIYWSRFPGVTKHNGHKIPDAANPIAITDLAPNTTYYFVVTMVGDAGESKESTEMSFTGMGATGVVDFKNLFEQPSSSHLPPTVNPEKVPPSKPAPDATPKKAPSATHAQATLAWDNVPGAIAYNIYWRNQPGVTKDNGRKIANVKNPHRLKDLLPGKTYYLVVSAVSENGESRVSEEISYTAE